LHISAAAVLDTTASRALGPIPRCKKTATVLTLLFSHSIGVTPPLKRPVFPVDGQFFAGHLQGLNMIYDDLSCIPGVLQEFGSSAVLP